MNKRVRGTWKGKEEREEEKKGWIATNFEMILSLRLIFGTPPPVWKRGKETDFTFAQLVRALNSGLFPDDRRTEGGRRDKRVGRKGSPRGPIVTRLSLCSDSFQQQAADRQTDR